ncbi:uncharacterized protein LOC125134453 [Phacochoerus africanus]|uniref:uncharacterized protein LOC125134453 n=1 Tax=Phacochoerus africanus TaxID=41426 RepID=UPI001FD9B45E|nr:uncharacterized protein LOC125134453 [Phacochoerus africanus]
MCQEYGTPSINFRTAQHLGKSTRTRSLPGKRSSLAGNFPFKRLRAGPRKAPTGSRCAPPRSQIPPLSAVLYPAAPPRLLAPDLLHSLPLAGFRLPDSRFSGEESRPTLPVSARA